MAKNKTTTSRIRLVRDGLEFEAEGDHDFVLDMIKQFAVVGPSKTLTSPDTSIIPGKLKKSAAPLDATNKGLSVREFILQLDSRKHTDLVLAFGYYLEKNLDQTAFTPADINNLYYEAKLDTSNTSHMIIQNIKRGLMMEAKKADEGGKKRYVLTNSGEKYIKDLLSSSSA